MATEYVPPPVFSAQPTLSAPVSKESQDLGGQILAFLQSKNEPTKTIDIARHVFGKDAKAKDVNPTLYRMSHAGSIVKTAKDNGGDPRWSLKKN